MYFTFSSVRARRSRARTEEKIKGCLGAGTQGSPGKTGATLG